MSTSKATNAVETALSTAKAIAFDGCHKIYILMDDEQVKTWTSYGYGDGTDDSKLLTVESPRVALAYVRDWYEASCFLRFVNSVRTTADPYDGYDQLIPQGGWHTGVDAVR
jgi:hypothetical protein